MNLWFRLVWALLSWRSRGPLPWQQMGSRPFRVWPTDLDIFNHMNNGKFLSLLDLGRFDLLLRSGLWQKLRKRNWYPVVVAETITFRKSLSPWLLFDLESKVIGWDEHSIYVEQRFVVKGEIYAQAFVRIRFLVNPRGIVTPAQLIEMLGGWQGTVPVLPEWIKNWSQDSSMPKGKEPAPSVWN